MEIIEKKMQLQKNFFFNFENTQTKVASPLVFYYNKYNLKMSLKLVKTFKNCLKKTPSSLRMSLQQSKKVKYDENACFNLKYFNSSVITVLLICILAMSLF